jgi:hypothetical protein
MLTSIGSAKKFPLTAAPSIPAARGQVDVGHERSEPQRGKPPPNGFPRGEPSRGGPHQRSKTEPNWNQRIETLSGILTRKQCVGRPARPDGENPTIGPNRILPALEASTRLRTHLPVIHRLGRPPPRAPYNRGKAGRTASFLLQQGPQQIPGQDHHRGLTRCRQVPRYELEKT